ncbi:LINE-1 retrotransposable element ORF2 protein [Vitis vinifera]|uniref:LINE-1 retrotransposable element ORF2 protein n=1 Tax=Vitis vinifera TaxID=29760 RepID=A0A438JQU8_VITVI|nr:LINE-1 retrotransposable element ORF2 protein [Vitis vinifera]
MSIPFFEVEGECVGDGWTPLFSRALNDWELEMMEQFMLKIQAFRVQRENEDKMVWTASRSGVFSVKSLYSTLEPGGSALLPYVGIWRACVPPKVRMIRNQSVVVERKIFQVKSEDYNGGKWLSITERSRGFVVSLDFGEEETGWLVEQLEKAVELEDSRGYIRKMRGKTRTHLMEICFNSRGCYMKITEYSAKRKPLVLVVPRGVNGCGWENLRKVIASVQELSVQVGRESKETQNKLQESKGMYRGERPTLRWLQRKEQGMVQGCQLENGQERWFVKAKEIYETGVRKAQWFQERGSFTVRGEVFALRRWSPEENSVVRGKFRRGWLELRGLPFHLWDEVHNIAGGNASKGRAPALLEVEDGDWTYTVAVTVTGEDDGEDDGGDSIKPESSRSKDEMRSAGGCVLQKPQMVEGLRAIDRTSDCQRWMPRHRLHFSSSDSKSAKGEKGKGRWVSGPMAGSNVGPTPDVFEARSVWAQVGAKDFGPIAGPAHKGSSNGGPVVSSSSKLQRPGLSAKNKASEGLPQASSKTKGSPVSVRRRARSGPPSLTRRLLPRSVALKEFPPARQREEGILQCKLINEVRNPISAVSERDLPLSGAFESILIPETSVSLGHPFCVTLLLRVVVPLETSNQKSKDRPFLREIPSNLEVRGDSGEALFPVQEPSTLPLEGFQVEGLTPRKMVKVQSVLESLRVRIVRDNGKGVGENRNPSLRTRFIPEERRKRILELEERISSGCGLCWVVIVLMKILSGIQEETKREIWDRRLVSSIWKGKSLDWVALPACGASGGIVILWDSVKFNCSEKVVEGGLLVGASRSTWSTFPRWCVGGDFNVIRRISEKMGDSRLTVNMRRFDEFIRESEALPRWTSDHSPICLETNPFMWGPTPFRFENMWLLHPEFKEKFRDWWQECTVEGWEGDSWKIEGIDWAPISEESAIWLDRPFSEEEVRMAVFQLNKEKAPGPDGFTLAVYQECWDVIKEDLMRVFFEFHTKGVINQSTNATFIAMVPKKSQTFKISDYRPISLVTSLYKIIAKVLSGRLRKVLHETIFGSRSLCGRETNLDAVLIANEVVDEKRRSGEEGVVFKIDFEKAYDHVEWGFLDHVLQRKGFSQKWRSWMRGCLSSSSFAILVNGNAKGWVKASRGLRQGDPLSPFLFTLVADVLSRLMIRAEETGITEGFLVGRDRTRVSLLQFADDTIFFSKASLDLLQNLKIILLVFGQVSGLKINLEKSTISGLPLGGNPKTIGFWDPVVERISRRLDGWKKAYLSLGGRITLIQSSSKIEKMQRDFLWSGAGEGKRDHLIRWEVVSRPREMGGLGFGKTSMRNSALLGKWLWRFPRERSGLWHKVIASIYGTHPNGWDANMVVRWSHRCPWKAIAQVFKSSPLLSPSGGQWGENSVLGRSLVGKPNFVCSIC